LCRQKKILACGAEKRKEKRKEGTKNTYWPRPEAGPPRRAAMSRKTQKFFCVAPAAKKNFRAFPDRAGVLHHEISKFPIFKKS
jgi:hypothetical protein